jgi:ADP-heptose:LPS heptosyltransferase
VSAQLDRGKVHCVAIVSRLSGRFDLGDIVLSNAVVRLVRQQFPESRIVLFARREELARYQDRFYVPHSWIDDFQVCPALEEKSILEWLRLYRKLRSLRADLCISNIQGLPGWFLFLAGVPLRMGFRFRFSKRWHFWFLTHPVSLNVQDPRSIHWSDFVKAYAEALSGSRTFAVQQLVPYVRYASEPAESTDGVRKPLVVMHIGGAVHWNRRWPRESYLEVCLRLTRDVGAAIALVGGTEERLDTAWLIERLRRTCPQARVSNFTGCSINRMLNLYSRADLYVGNDSGLMHLAVALGLPVVAVFGPSKHLFWGPDRIDPRHQAVTLGLPCTDGGCKIGCPAHYDVNAPDYPTCLKRIDVASVWAAIAKRLQAGASCRS